MVILLALTTRVTGSNPVGSRILESNPLTFDFTRLRVGLGLKINTFLNHTPSEAGLGVGVDDTFCLPWHNSFLLAPRDGSWLSNV